LKVHRTRAYCRARQSSEQKGAICKRINRSDVAGSQCLQERLMRNALTFVATYGGLRVGCLVPSEQGIDDFVRTGIRIAV
jgi:hypothetical protein